MYVCNVTLQCIMARIMQSLYNTKNIFAETKKTLDMENGLWYIMYITNDDDIVNVMKRG